MCQPDPDSLTPAIPLVPLELPLHSASTSLLHEQVVGVLGEIFTKCRDKSNLLKNKMFKLEHIILLALNLKRHNIIANNFSVHGFPRALTNCLQRSTYPPLKDIQPPGGKQLFSTP